MAITIGIGIEIRRMSPVTDGLTLYCVDGRSSGIVRQSRIHAFLTKVNRVSGPSLVVPAEKGEEYERHGSLSHAANNTDVNTILGSEIPLGIKEYCLFKIEYQIISPRASNADVVNFGETRYFTACIDNSNLYLALAGTTPDETPILTLTEFDQVVT